MYIHNVAFFSVSSTTPYMQGKDNLSQKLYLPTMQCYVQKNTFLVCRRNIRLPSPAIDSFLYATAENSTNGVKFWLTSTLLSMKKHPIFRPKLRNKLKLMHFFRLIKNQLFIATAFLPFVLQAFLSITCLHYSSLCTIFNHMELKTVFYRDWSH